MIEIIEMIILIVLGLNALVFILGNSIQAAFTIYEQLTWWFDAPGYDHLGIHPLWCLKTLLFGLPGTIFGIIIWLIIKIPKFIFKSIFK